MRLVVHAGARITDLNGLAAVPVPKETPSYKPLPHVDFIDMIKEGLDNSGFTVTQEQYAMSTPRSKTRTGEAQSEGDQLFGCMVINHSTADFETCVALRNSYDKSMSATFGLGNSVFVCDNLALLVEFLTTRRHVGSILSDLPNRIAALIARLPEVIEMQVNQLNSYKAIELGPMNANDLVVRAAQAGIVPSNKILRVLDEFSNPRHAEFSDPTLWSMINAFTEILKGSNIFELQSRTMALYDLANKELD